MIFDGKWGAEFAMEWFDPKNRAKRKARRKAFRKARKGKELTPEEGILMAEQTSTVTLPSGETITRAEPTIPARTSTKALVGGTFLAQVYVQLVGLIPNQGVVDALTTPEMTALVAVGLAALVARFTKSPAKPGAL